MRGNVNNREVKKIEHAEFMSGYFNAHHIPAMFLTGASPDEERNNAKKKLVSGEVRFIFVVDIYNEGVDIPEVNTVLFLRPTESLTIFLQQLGRGLRLAEGKECLTVLDFIGQANKKYNFEDKFAALLSGESGNVQKEIKVSNVSRDADELTFCARLLSARKHPVGMYFIGEDIFTLASYYQRDLRDRHFFPSEDWQSLPSDDDDLPTAPQSTIGGLLE